MPYYLFSNPNTNEIREIFFHMNDEKLYIDENGLKWNREFIVPQAGIDTKIDPHSQAAFMNKTNKAGTLNDLYDLSRDLSEKRGGIKNDPVKREYNKKWKETRKLNHTPKSIQ